MNTVKHWPVDEPIHQMISALAAPPTAGASLSEVGERKRLPAARRKRAGLHQGMLQVAAGFRGVLQDHLEVLGGTSGPEGCKPLAQAQRRVSDPPGRAGRTRTD